MSLPFLPHVETAQRELQREQGERIWCLRRDGVLVACAPIASVLHAIRQAEKIASLSMRDADALADLACADTSATHYQHGPYTLALEAHGGAA